MNGNWLATRVDDRRRSGYLEEESLLLLQVVASWTSQEGMKVVLYTQDLLYKTASKDQVLN